MTDESKKLLTDIKQAIANLDVHLQGKRDFIEFAKNITIRRAVEREFEIIGEATNNLLKKDAAFPLTAAKKLLAFATVSYMRTMMLMKPSFGK